MVLKGVKKGTQWLKLGQMVLKGVNWVDNNKIRSTGVERSKLGTQYKNQVVWSLKESIGFTMIKFGSYGLERSQLGTQWQKSGHMVLKGVNYGTQW